MIVVICGGVMRCIDCSPQSRMGGLGECRASCIVDLGVFSHAFAVIATFRDLETQKGRAIMVKSESYIFINACTRINSLVYRNSIILHQNFQKADETKDPLAKTSPLISSLTHPPCNFRTHRYSVSLISWLLTCPHIAGMAIIWAAWI